MEPLSGTVLEIVRAHAVLALPIVFLLAFGESLAFVSLLLPATILLVGGGGIVSAAGIGFWPMWGAAAAGATLGDWVSYWLGFYYKEAIGGIWPLSRHPLLLLKGRAFFEKWGRQVFSSAGFSGHSGASCRWLLVSAPCRSSPSKSPT